jgi:branched-subunit amino acid aminotransferase/4-amino-4-deoxychorismate lyase
MEAATVPLQAESTGLFASLKVRRRARRVRRLLSDAERFERAATRLEAQIEPDSWQVRQLRGSAEQLRELALAEAA